MKALKRLGLNRQRYFAKEVLFSNNVIIRDGAINKKCTHLHFFAFVSRLLHFYSHMHLQVLLLTHL